MTPERTITRLNRDKGVPAFLKATLEALQLSGRETQRLRRLTDDEWQNGLAFCDLAHLTLPLVRAGGDAIPGWVRTRTGQNLADNRMRIQQIRSVYEEIACAFHDGGIQHVVLKGFAQYPAFAESLEDRMQSDIDLYCPEASIPAARAALVDLGYAGNPTLDKFPADHLPEMTRRKSWKWRGNAYDPEMPPAVDLHFCLWNYKSTRLSIAGVNEFWDRRIQQQVRDFSFPALCSIDNVAYCALHVLRDIFRGDWVLHHVYELAWFLHTHAGDEALWLSWEKTHDDGFRSVQAISFWLARAWFGCRLPEAVEFELSVMPANVRAWLERFSSSPLTGMFQPNKHGVWLHVALLESRLGEQRGLDRVRVLGNTLMPLRLPAVGAPGQDATKFRRMRRWWPSQRHAKYVLHVVFRAGFHLQTMPNALWHGFCWWLDQRELSRNS